MKMETMYEVCGVDKLSECMRLQVLWVVVSGNGFLAQLVTVRCYDYLYVDEVCYAM